MSDETTPDPSGATAARPSTPGAGSVVPPPGAGSVVPPPGAGSVVPPPVAGATARGGESATARTSALSATEPPGSREDVLGGSQYAAEPRLPQFLRRPVARGVVGYLLALVVVGALAGVLWHSLADLPSYTLAADGSGAATTSERSLTSFFSTDAWFCGLGLVIGLAAGLLAWTWFHRLGWLVVPIALVGSELAALVCWWVGQMLGPGDFATRMAQAGPGQVVPIDFLLRSHSSLLVWPFFAVIPVLLFSSLGRDEQAPRGTGPRLLGRRRPAAVVEQSDERQAVQTQ